MPVANAHVFRPDGRVVVAETGNFVAAFAVPSGEKLWSARVGQSSGTPPAFSPDGRWMAVADGKKVALYDPRTGGRALTVVVPGEHPSDPVHFEFSRTGRWLVGCYAGGEDALVVWDTLSGKGRRLDGAEAFPLPVFDPNGSGLIAAANAVFFRWDLATGRRGAELDVPIGDTNARAVSPDGRVLALAGGAAVGLWDLAADKPLPLCPDPPRDLSGVWFGPHGRVVGWTADDIVRPVSWDLQTGQSRPVFGFSFGTLSPDERFVTFHAPDGLEVRDLLRDTIRKRAYPKMWDFGPGAFSADGTRFVSWADKGVCAWDLPAGRRLTVPADHIGEVSAFALSGNGAVAASGWATFDTDRPKPVAVVVDFGRKAVAARVPLAGMAMDLALSPRGDRFAALIEIPGGNDDEVAYRMDVFDVRTGATACSFHGVGDVFNVSTRGSVMAFTPDARTLAVSAGTRAVLWEVVTGRPRAAFPHAGPVGAPAFRPDGRVLAVPSTEAPVYLWDVMGTHRPAAEPTRDGLERAWRQLASPDAAAGFAAVRLLARFPALAAPFLREKLPPAPPVDSVRVRELAAKLDAADFRVRTAAGRELAGLADRAEPLLRELRAGAGSPEAAGRLDGLIAGARRPDRAAVRAVRAVEALEWAGTPATRSVLAEWDRGAAGAWLTTEAAAALHRLG
jgi:WD40 repeat protein